GGVGAPWVTHDRHHLHHPWGVDVAVAQLPDGAGLLRRRAFHPGVGRQRLVVDVDVELAADLDPPCVAICSLEGLGPYRGVDAQNADARAGLRSPSPTVRLISAGHRAARWLHTRRKASTGRSISSGVATSGGANLMVG